MQDIDSILAVAEENIRYLRSNYKTSLRIKVFSPMLQARVKNALENQRSALDYVAYEVTRKFGLGSKKHVTYPMANSKKDFEHAFPKRMPGVIDSSIRRLVEQNQPYTQAWVRYLSDLVNAHKHRRLVPQVMKVKSTTVGSRYLDWHFEDPDLSVIATLNQLQWCVNALIDEMYEAADLRVGMRVSDVLRLEVRPEHLEVPIRDYDLSMKCRLCKSIQLLTEALRRHPDRQHTVYDCANGCGSLVTVRPLFESASKQWGLPVKDWVVHGNGLIKLLPQQKATVFNLWTGPEMTQFVGDDEWQDHADVPLHPPPLSDTT